MNEIDAFLMVGFTLDIVFIYEYYRKKMKALLFFKTVSSIVFVCLGIALTLQYANTLWSWIIVCGLICGVFGDFFLDAGPVFPSIEKQTFIIGFGAFFLGHLCYISRSMHLLINSGNGLWIILALLISLCLGGWIIKMMFGICMPTKDILYVGIAYLLTIDFSCMLAWTLMAQGQGSLALAIGTTVFAVSDHMLVVDYFGFKKVNWLHGGLLILYYLAQVLIAISIVY